MSRTATRVLRRGGSGLLWYGLPGLALATVAAYILAAILLHVNPPVVPIEGVSMRPTLQTGELVLLEGVEPSRIRKGEIIAVNVPKEARQKYNLPGRVVHRVIKIEHTAGGLLFQTKGDGNSGPDVFTVNGNEVVGRMRDHLPGLGYPLLFFRSTQGKILAGAIALIAALYFALGLFEERQTATRGTALGLQAVMAQTEEIKQALRGVGPPHPSDPSHPPERTDQAAASGPPAQPRDENTELLGKLLVAVGEYGEHLRSHTAVMQGLALATSDLRQATQELRRAAVDPNPGRPRALQPLDVGMPFVAAVGQDPSAATFSPPPVPLPALVKSGSPDLGEHAPQAPRTASTPISPSTPGAAPTPMTPMPQSTLEAGVTPTPIPQSTPEATATPTPMPQPTSDAVATPTPPTQPTSDAVAKPTATTPEHEQPGRAWTREPTIEPRALLLLAATTAAGVYLRRRAKRTH